MVDRIGIWGGTFDPIHRGHLHLASQLRVRLRLDQMRLMPAKLPPHRYPHSPADDRLAMLQLALLDYSDLSCDDRELAREGLSYSVVSCREYRDEHPRAAIFWCMGFDAFAQFHTWFCYREILQLVNIAVVARPGFDNANFDAAMRELSAVHSYHLAEADTDATSGSVVSLSLDLVDISSSQIRHNIRAQQPSDFLAPAVMQYIYDHQLYKL